MQNKLLFSLIRLRFHLVSDKLIAMKSDPALLKAALAGYENRLTEIDEAIAEIQRRLGRRKGSPSGGKNRLSPAARERIAAAQRRRWAEFKKNRGKS